MALQLMYITNNPQIAKTQMILVLIVFGLT